MKKRILVLCTGNSCRSQMAEGFLKSFDSELEVFSAGVDPAEKVNSIAITVMREAGIDISYNKPENVDKYLSGSFDYVITVCDNARETCPVFSGKVNERIHIGFEDPYKFEGTDDAKIRFYRKIRDEIRTAFSEFYNTYLIGK